MIEKLVVDFFKKVEENEGRTKTHGKSRFLVEELLEKKYGKFNYINKQKATKIQKKYIDKDPDASASLEDVFLKDVMAKYLGYEDYNDFVNKNQSKDVNQPVNSNKSFKEKDNPRTNKKRKWLKAIGLSTASILGISYFSYQSFVVNTSNCIIWNGQQYEKTPCDTYNAISDSNGTINIDAFKRIAVNENTVFFRDGKAIIWYGKNKEGKMEYFSSRGEHPETKKELKRITPYILNKEGLLSE